MQLHLRLDADPTLARLRDRLRQAFGAPTAFMRRDPVSQLVRSMIGSRTYDAVSEAVFSQLRARFHPWSRLADARFDEVAPLVAPVTYAEDKGRRLIAALALVRRQVGAIRLDFLEPWPLEDAMAWLQALPGRKPEGGRQRSELLHPAPSSVRGRQPRAARGRAGRPDRAEGRRERLPRGGDGRRTRRLDT